MNSLAGLAADYGDSDEEHENSAHSVRPFVGTAPLPTTDYPMDPATAAAVHPPPIPHCPWSACYDEGSGFTYYWNQQTNAVTWEAPPEYMLALKLAQQHLHMSGSPEVSAEEWRLYQQALTEKQNSQNKLAAKAAILKPVMKKEVEKPVEKERKQAKFAKKRRASENEEDKIELITSFYNSDSDSNDEGESPIKPSTPPKPKQQNPVPKLPIKKPKKQPALEYGPSLPPNQDYSVPIGPELPLEMTNECKMPENKPEVIIVEDKKTPKVTENEDSQDEKMLLMKLKNKAKLLEKLGGEIPSELQQIIKDNTLSETPPPPVSEAKNTIDTNIDDLLEEIEKKELPKVKSKAQFDMFEDNNSKTNERSARNSPKSIEGTPPRGEIKPLFPSSTNIVDEPETPTLFPSSANVQENGDEEPIYIKSETPPPPLPTEKKTNMYLTETSNVTSARKKLRISNSVLPDRNKSETPSYTTKYSTHIDGFSSERTGLGFSKEDDEETTPKSTISYGNGLTFTKGETLNEDKKDEDLDDQMDLVEAKLNYLNQLQPCMVTPVQEMLIQMQALAAAFRGGALAGGWWRRWVCGAAHALAGHEARAAPAGWALAFQRDVGRYRYERVCDGLQQWEYPAPPADMDICTTPPPPPSEKFQEDVIVTPPLPPPPPPPPSSRTPPPPAWADPPPPGTDDTPPPPLPPVPPKQEIGDELASFYNDIAELEKQDPPAPPPLPPIAVLSPEKPPLPPYTNNEHEKKEKERDGKTKKKSKVKISTSIGLKHKSVSHLVAKWQQVADEINSD